MTQYWGPLGWATLHSVSALYPDTPTDAEQALARHWIDSFAACITCPKCQGHFSTMYARYLTVVPNPFSSRREFVLFVLRAHNTVNRRLGKRMYTLEDSLAEAQRWIPDTVTARSRRNQYIQYLRLDWGRQTTLAGITALMRVRDLSMSEQQYWRSRELDWADVASRIGSADILTPIVTEQAAQTTVPPVVQIRPQRFQPRSTGTSGLFSLISR